MRLTHKYQNLVFLLFAFFGTLIITFLRLFSTRRSYFTELVYAEDGLFTLCYLEHSIYECLTSTYQGYLLILPKILLLPISFLDLPSWAASINFTAVVFFSLINTFNFWLIAQKVNKFIALFLTLGVVIVPIGGIETLGVVASFQTYLLVTSFLVATRSEPSNSYDKLISQILVLLIAFSNPLSIALIPIMVIYNRADYTKERFKYIIFLGIGFFIQIFIAILNQDRRLINMNNIDLSSIPRILFDNFMLLIPGLNFADVQRYDYMFYYQSSLKFVSVICVVLIALYYILSPKKNNLKIELLLGILTGALFLLIPVLILGENNRYGVAPITIWFLSIFMYLSRKIINKHAIYLALALTAYMWIPNFSVSEFRVSGKPWAAEVERLITNCSNKEGVEKIFFNPNDWPWSMEFSEPFSNEIICETVLEKIQ